MTTVMLPILSTLRIIDLGRMIAETNTIRVTILIIATITTIIVINHGEKSVIFLTRKIFALINISMMSNRRQKNFRDKTENSAKINANIMHF